MSSILNVNLTPVEMMGEQLKMFVKRSMHEGSDNNELAQLLRDFAEYRMPDPHLNKREFDFEQYRRLKEIYLESYGLIGADIKKSSFKGKLTRAEKKLKSESDPTKLQNLCVDMRMAIREFLEASFSTGRRDHYRGQKIIHVEIRPNAILFKGIIDPDMSTPLGNQSIF